jgi:cAMP-dependent protein kinase regulator
MYCLFTVLILLLQLQVLVDVIKRVEVKPGDYVIKQGDIGDRFYIIDSGTFEVRVQQDGIEVSCLF